MDPTTVGLIGLVILVILLFSRMPVGFVMALVGFVGFSYLVSLEAGLRVFAKDVFDIFGSCDIFPHIQREYFFGIDAFFDGRQHPFASGS